MLQHNFSILFSSQSRKITLTQTSYGVFDDTKQTGSIAYLTFIVVFQNIRSRRVHQKLHDFGSVLWFVIQSER